MADIITITVHIELVVELSSLVIETVLEHCTLGMVDNVIVVDCHREWRWSR